MNGHLTHVVRVEANFLRFVKRKCNCGNYCFRSICFTFVGYHINTLFSDYYERHKKNERTNEQLL